MTIVVLTKYAHQVGALEQVIRNTLGDLRVMVDGVLGEVEMRDRLAAIVRTLEQAPRAADEGATRYALEHTEDHPRSAR